MSANVLSDKDINTSAPNTTKSTDNVMKDVQSMEHHRQVLQSRLAEDGYVVYTRSALSYPIQSRLFAY